jgi:hypothetical protein
MSMVQKNKHLMATATENDTAFALRKGFFIL